MSNRKLLVLAIVLVSVGLVGAGITWVLLSDPSSPVLKAAFSSAGQRIYYTGIGADDLPIPRTVAGAGMMGFGMMGAVACVDCHGEDGRGGAIGMMFGRVEVADIRYSELTRTHTEDGTTKPGWTDAEITRAIREGLEPDGQRLKAPMPRWDMTDAEVKDVIAYLKELSVR